MRHYDCTNYLPTDVFKGICKRTKESVNADEAPCENFEQAKKCKTCMHFTYLDTDMGMCMNRFDAYPEMNAITCHDYRAN